jgi:TolA-binding protein
MKKSLIIAMISVMSVSFGATAFANSNKVDPIAALTATVNAVQTTVTGLVNRVTALETVVTGLQTSVAQNASNITKNASEIVRVENTQTARNDFQDGNINALKAENDALKARLDALEASQAGDKLATTIKNEINTANFSIYSGYGGGHAYAIDVKTTKTPDGKLIVSVMTTGGGASWTLGDTGNAPTSHGQEVVAIIEKDTGLKLAETPRWTANNPTDFIIYTLN